MAEFQEIEKADALRLTWNIWPNRRVDATKCVIPFAALYTPNKVLENMPVRSLMAKDPYTVGVFEHQQRSSEL